MSVRRLLSTMSTVAVAAVIVIPVGSAAASPPAADNGIRNVVPITTIYAFGQKVSAVAVEYGADVNPRTLDLDSFTVSDSLYNFRFDPIADLTDPAKRADRTVTRVYTNDTATTEPDGQSDRGRFVIVELSADDPGGNTVIVSLCPTFMCSVKINDDLQTRVVQNDPVYAQAGNGVGRGPLVSAPDGTEHPASQPAVNQLADEFVHERFTGSTGTVLPVAYHLPKGYDASRKYPVVVILPGHGMGFDGQNEGVQVAADIPATAWLQPEWTGTDEDVIVLAPQNQRIGTPTAQAALMVEQLNDFTSRFAVDTDRIYASTVSYGSTTAWAAMTANPGLFDGVLITGGFAVSTAQAAAIAAAGTPVWITHGTNDHLLNVATTGRASFNRIWAAYAALGKTSAEIQALLRYTEYGDEAFGLPDRHLAAAPTYEDASILQWLLDQ